jgi:hypothetical protein
MSKALPVGMNQLKSLLRAISPNVVVCIRGRHAVGKSEAVAQFAEEKGLPLIMRRLSQMTEGDLLGLPSMTKTSGGSDATAFHPCEWFIEACERPCVVFLDERNRALDAVKQAVFEVCDSRQLYGHKLHPGSFVVIAENVGDHYAVQQCDPAEVSRCVTVELDPSADEWIEYAKNYCHSATTEYIFQNKNALEFSGKNFEPDKKYPDRRSWFKLDNELQRLNLFDNPQDALFYTLCAGFLGTEVGQSFTSFCKTREKQLGAKDILKNWEACKKKLGGVDKIENGKFVELANKIAEHCKENKLTEAQAKQIVAFLKDCPPEPRMAAYRGLSANLDNMRLVHVDAKNLMVETIKGS